MKPRRSWVQQSVLRFGPQSQAGSDPVSVEEPLEIRLVSREENIPLATLLRTPGDDFELVAGFLFAEGLIHDHRDLGMMSFCARGEMCEDAPSPNNYNVVTVALRQGIPERARASARLVATHSGCGLCSKTSFDPGDLCNLSPGPSPPIHLDPHWLTRLPQQLASTQSQFRRTGGVHAAALVPWGGQLSSLCEDVGRHNAVDKLIGKEILAKKCDARRGLPPGHLLLLSGRAGFELLQKAVRARIEVVASLGAPTSLSVEWARKSSTVLLGFLGPERFNVYAGAERLVLAPPGY